MYIKKFLRKKVKKCLVGKKLLGVSWIVTNCIETTKFCQIFSCNLHKSILRECPGQYFAYG